MLVTGDQGTPEEEEAIVPDNWGLGATNDHENGLYTLYRQLGEEQWAEICVERDIRD